MAIGERIRFMRNLRGMTQRWLGQAVGFPAKTADIRMAQYESGTRTPKEDLVNALANVLEVSPLALKIPDIDSDLGFIHTPFRHRGYSWSKSGKTGRRGSHHFRWLQAEYGCVCLRNAVCLG